MDARQQIFPRKIQFFTGETVTFRLIGIDPKRKGRAVLRTNIGGGRAKIAEQIEKTEKNRTPKGADWHDIGMTKTADGTFEVKLPLTETGVFEAKCCFLPSDGSAALWASGANFRLKVFSALNAAGNGIYCCFVRQFGTWVHLPHSPEQPDFSTLDQQGYTVIPPSGTFRGVIARLDHIFDKLNCRILQLLPVHPVPVSYGRMGRYGSPFAATDYFSVDPALADFDTRATPMDQFVELIDAVHARGGRIFMDMPVNHTGWASKLQNEHPEFFLHNEKGEFVSPGAWGVTWADLCQLDYRKRQVHDLMAKVFLFWCKRGVDGFRCDAGYMVPAEAWKYILARVRREYPDTTFLLEGLGGPRAIQEELLERIGLDWGYSELFQNYSRDEISAGYPGMADSCARGGVLVNFAETHDNLRLAAGGKVYARSRFLVNALLSFNGAFGFANGAEFFAAEKIDVHQCGALNFGAVDNLCGLVGRINLLLALHPAFGGDAQVSLIQHGPGNVIAARRGGGEIPELLVLINLDCENPAEVHFSGIEHASGHDLLSGKDHELLPDGPGSRKCPLGPGEGVCLAFDDFRLPEHLPPVSEKRLALRAAAMAQDAALNFGNLASAAAADGELLRHDPEKFLETVSGISPAPAVVWRYPQDSRRTVMAAPGDLLLLRSRSPFSADLAGAGGNLHRVRSLPLAGDAGHFALVRLPHNHRDSAEDLQLEFTSFDPAGVHRITGTVSLLSAPEKTRAKLTGRWNDAAAHLVFGSNDRGSYSLFSAQWGKHNSKYDAILAVNDAPDYPSDRHVMLTGCRAWLVMDEYSQELNGQSLETYSAHPGNRAKWDFLVPDGRGGRCSLTVEFRMAENADTAELTFSRPPSSAGMPPPGKLILRPDIEDRVNHGLTRACDGAEHHFRESVRYLPDGFDFQPGRLRLRVRSSAGEFREDPEWRYMEDLPVERYYGMGDKTDLFSPGYFTVPLAPGESVTLTASAEPDGAPLPVLPPSDFPASLTPEELSGDALRRFVVRRDGLSTVIAGYPWFLDWGRDTLIVLRGLVKFPEFRPKCAEIIRRFAAFESFGTIPNMICGGNDSNRDTSDAPLLLILAVRDYLAASGDRKFLSADCGGRPLREILHSIIRHYRHGTPNGIVMDPESGLIFSPAHFSWMDTNYPAGTPREGYPVEIQSLWFAALKFLGEEALAEKVRAGITGLYFSGGRIADCLHGRRGTPAAEAVPDDHLRCNILTAITSGAVVDERIRKDILRAAGYLLVPGAIRTLDDADVDYALPIELNGQLLNDPHHPYKGSYKGPEDTERKAAYHNGTAWCWPFPAYCEALYLTGGEPCRKRALSLLLSMVRHLENGVVGELPEVLDGDVPHRGGGCPAQAWSVSEFYRVLDILRKP